MTETPIFNPRLAQPDRRRGEWVELEAGRLYVREMNARDSLFVLEHSQRQGQAGQPTGLNIGSVQTWQIVVSCYNGPGADAPRIFALTDIEVVQGLRAAEWRKLLDAIERVNSLADEEVSALQDFTPAPGESSLGTSPSGASSSCTASPASSTPPPVSLSLP